MRERKLHPSRMARPPQFAPSLLAARIIEDICPGGETIPSCVRAHTHIYIARGKMHEGWSVGYLAAEFRVHWHFRARAIDPAFTCVWNPESVCVWNYFNSELRLNSAWLSERTFFSVGSDGVYINNSHVIKRETKVIARSLELRQGTTGDVFVPYLSESRSSNIREILQMK